MKIWKPSTADQKFNAWIIQRDQRCVKCGTKDHLTCSHFWGVKHSLTRYDPENCDALCFPHHFGNRVTGWEYNKQGEYARFKLRQLGQARYEALERRAQTFCKLKDAITTFQTAYQEGHYA